MTILGELLGYGAYDEDILGYPRDPQQACPACGVHVALHSGAQTAMCFHKLYAEPEGEITND